MMKARTRRQLLHEEGAYVSGVWDKTDMTPEVVAARRKYRKLGKLAEQQGLSLESLLIARRDDRRWEKTRAAVGKMAAYADGYRYAVRVLDTHMEPKFVLRWSESKQAYRRARHTERYVRFVVCGYLSVRSSGATHPPSKYEEPLPVGHEGNVPFDRIAVREEAVARSLADCAAFYVRHAEECAEREKKDPLWFTIWTEATARWKNWVAAHDSAQYGVEAP